MAQIDRSGATALMPEDASREIIQGIPQFSSVMRLGRKLPNMTRAQRRLPVLSALATAYFVTGEPSTGSPSAGRKQTTSMAWANKYIDAEELAVIVPIPQAVLDDADYPIWDEVTPRIKEAFGVAFDAAVFYGTNAPGNWPDDIVTAATTAGNVVTFGTGADLYEDILGEGGVVAKVEEDGFFVGGHVAAMTMRARLRGVRDANGVPLFNRSMQETTRYELDGAEVIFPRNGAVDPAESLLISGDWSQLVWAIRQDIDYTILREATIYDTDGTTVLYRLAQQDMVALRATMRLGWQVPNPINRLQAVEANRYPFGVLTPAS